MSTEVRYTHDGAIARITFAGPKGINILSTTVLEKIEASLDQASKNTAVRIVIFTGAERTFLAGADIKEMSDASADAGRAFSRRGQACMDKIANFDQAVTIAAINGATIGGGCELALACDLRVIAEAAQIGLPEVKLGLIPGWGGTQRMYNLVGPSRARRLIFTGEPVDGKTAVEIGLADIACPAEMLNETVGGLAQKILANGPQAVRGVKRLYSNMEKALLERGLAAEAELFGQAFGGAEGREGLKAFLEKRKANWQFTFAAC